MPFIPLNDALSTAFRHGADYESPAEEMLGERLRAALAPGAAMDFQVWVETIAGRFRLDIRLTTPKGRCVAVEVDGREFHDGKRDFWRSILILGAGAVDTVYRVAASDLHRNLSGVLLALARAEPSCFDARMKAQWASAVDTTYPIETPDDDEEWDEGELGEDQRPARGYGGLAYLAPLRLESPGGSYGPYYTFAQQSQATTLDELLQAWETRTEDPM